MNKSEVESWISNYYSSLGGEISIAMSTINSNQSWTVTIVSAINSGIILRGFISDIWTWILLIIGLSLTIRFFIRSCLAYTNLIRWNTIKRKINKLKLNPYNKELQIKDLLKTIKTYDFDWYSPISKINLIKSNLKYGYYYSFGSLLALIFYNLYVVYNDTKFCNPESFQIIGIGIIGLLVILWEVKIFFDPPYFKYVSLKEVKKESFSISKFVNKYRFILTFLIIGVGVILLSYTESESTILTAQDFNIKINNYLFYNNITYHKKTTLEVKLISSDKIGLGLSLIKDFIDYNQSNNGLKYDNYIYDDTGILKFYDLKDQRLSLFLFCDEKGDMFFQIYLIKIKSPLINYGIYTIIISLIMLTILLISHINKNK